MTAGDWVWVSDRTAVQIVRLMFPTLTMSGAVNESVIYHILVERTVSTLTT